MEDERLLIVDSKLAGEADARIASRYRVPRSAAVDGEKKQS